MVINHNLNALNSYNELNANVVGVKKSSEKLASGYRINRAADDAAGLAVSEKMRSQIRGLTQATRNAQDGVNFIQTAEGALGELHSILKRCKELATESANGTYHDEVDRDAIQLEVDQLRSEVDHIAMTDFNGRHCFEVEGSRFIPAYDHTKDPALISEQLKLGLISGVGKVQPADSTFNGYTPTQLVVNLDNGEKMNIALNFKEITFSDLDSEINEVAGKYGADSHDALKRFAEKLKTNVVPAVLAGIAENLPQIAGKRTKDGIEIGFDLYNAATSTLASVTSNGNHFKLSINMNTVGMIGDEIEISPDLWSTLAHEMTHAVMFDTTTSGMGGWGTPAVDQFPSWFTEGAAEVVGGGMDRLRELMPWVNNSGNPDSAITIGDPPGTPLSTLINNPPGVGDIETWMKNLTNSSTTGQAPSYEQGYAATMYLSWLAGGGADKSFTPIDANTIAKGLDKILIEINGGKSLSQVIDEVTGNKYKGLNDFVTSIQNGDTAAAQFVYNLIHTTGAKNSVEPSGKVEMNTSGSIIAPGGLGAPKDSLTTLGGSDGHFILVLEKNDGGNIYGEPQPGGTITFPNGDKDKYDKLYEGGGATKNANGDPYDEGSYQGAPIYVFMDELTPAEPFVLQLGARTKDSVHFTFEYHSDALRGLECDLNCTAEGLGLYDISVSTQSAANEAIDKLDRAINKVSLMRATFGAVENRLEHKIDNLTTTNENISEAESHIRDTDMATEMMAFTKSQIVQQAAQTMLTQANQLPQGVLQLLS